MIAFASLEDEDALQERETFTPMSLAHNTKAVWIGLTDRTCHVIRGLFEQIDSFSQFSLNLRRQPPKLFKLLLQKEPHASEPLAVFPNALPMLCRPASLPL